MQGVRKSAQIRVDRSRRYQTIDGFGVNINAKYWAEGAMGPVVDLLVDDLGATLFRLDGYGRADWVDPDGSLGREQAFSDRNYERVYSSRDFQNALGMARHLNARGIDPYITVSGRAPAWMCAADGKTLVDYDGFAEMTVNYASWLRKNGVRFTLFGPLNETDLGPPEGPLVPPDNYVKACEALVDTLDRYALGDVKLVVAEQGQFNMEYANRLLKSRKLAGRIGVMAMHAYSDFHVDALTSRITLPEHRHIRAWMTEFGDLRQSIELEEYIAWVSVERLMRLLRDGMHGALSWDAYDNYHDHDEAWTCFGLIMNAWDVFIPKKRYYALKHVYRFVRPGFRRIEAVCTEAGIPVLAFEGEEGKELTVVGMNPGGQAVALDLDLGFHGEASGLAYLDYDVYRTCSFEDCARITTPIVKLKNHASRGVEFTALPGSIFTITNVK